MRYLSGFLNYFKIKEGVGEYEACKGDKEVIQDVGRKPR
jgi:hypothetical protein